MFSIKENIYKLATVGLLVVCAGLGFKVFTQSVELKIQATKIESQEKKIQELNTEVADLTVKLDTAIGINKNLNTLIETQNKSVLELEKEKKELDDRLKKANLKADQIKKDYEARIQDLLREPVSNECSASMNWLRIKAPELSK